MLHIKKALQLSSIWELPLDKSLLDILCINRVSTKACTCSNINPQPSAGTKRSTEEIKSITTKREVLLKLFHLSSTKRINSNKKLLRTQPQPPHMFPYSQKAALHPRRYLSDAIKNNFIWSDLNGRELERDIKIN